MHVLCNRTNTVFVSGFVLYIYIIDLAHLLRLLAHLVDNMETDDAVDLMRELDEDTQEEILSHIEDVEQAGDIVDLLKYDEDTAGGLMGTEMIVVNENWSMPKCIDEMRKQAEEMSEIYYVYVVDDDERLKGVLPLQKLLSKPPRITEFPNPPIMPISSQGRRAAVWVNTLSEVSTSCEIPDANW